MLLWLALIHLAGILLFTEGFLLVQPPSSHPGLCREAQCSLPASYKRMVFLVVDSLRFDFLTPDPPQPVSPIYHNILRLPGELSMLDPQRSLLFSAYADPPTTTLQRIKGITAGTLPNFIDLGLTVSESWVSSLHSSGKKVKGLL